MAQDALAISTLVLDKRTRSLNSVIAENAATRQRLAQRRGAHSALACEWASLRAATAAPSAAGAPAPAAASDTLERQRHQHLQALVGAREAELRELAFRRLQHAFMLARLEANQAALARYLAEAEAALACSRAPLPPPSPPPLPLPGPRT